MKEVCAYGHDENKLIQQNYINQTVWVVVTKHHNLEITNNESPEQETDKASVEADSQESNSKSGKATKRNVSSQYCDNCLYKCKYKKTHEKHKTSKHK